MAGFQLVAVTPKAGKKNSSEVRKKILQFKWEVARKRLMQERLWSITTEELEALEATYWLRATGFTQYAKMYEEKSFPVDVNLIQQQHVGLDEDAHQALVRRLKTLNRCAQLLYVKGNGPLCKEPEHLQSRLEALKSACVLDRLHDGVSMCSPTLDPKAEGNFVAASVNIPREHCMQGVEAGTETLHLARTKPPVASFPLQNSCENQNLSEQESQCSVFISLDDHSTTKTVPDNGISISNFRSSIYDNVPVSVSDELASISMVSPSASPTVLYSSSDAPSILCTPPTPHDLQPNSIDIKFSLDRVFLTNLRLCNVLGNVQVLRQASEDEDDDVCSVSSQEDGELPESEIMVTRMDHLEVPDPMGLKSLQGMGSVDSGVPSSPVMRSPSVRRRRVRWHSFQKSDRESMLVSNKIMTLSAGQLNVLKKISLLRLTALLERYSVQNRGGWHWTVPKLLKKLKVPDYRGKNIYGVPLLTTALRTGSPLPHLILLAINYLRRMAVDSVGIFRKCGMKSRIDQLRTEIEETPDRVDFEAYSVYDVADALKQYFRELPEPLMTTKLGETLIAIHKDVPKELRLQAVQLAILLMPDENRDALQTTLLFLNEVASHARTNQMCEKNLATCFVPAFFHIWGGGKMEKVNQQSSAPKKLKRSSSNQTQKDLEDTMAAQECLAEMMKCVRFLFTVPEDVMMKCQFSYIEQGDPVPLEELGQSHVDPGAEEGYHGYLESCFTGLLEETAANSRFSKKWEVLSHCDEVEISFRKVNDGYPLRLWRASVLVEASPEDVMTRVCKERHMWDDEIVQWEVLETLDETTDVFYYETQSVAPPIRRDFVILRSWRRNLYGGCCAVVWTSIEHKSAPPVSGVRGTILACRCFIEPTGLGRSKMTYITRTDLRGRCSRYYNKAIAPRLLLESMRKIRDSFNIGPDGPETNV